MAEDDEPLGENGSKGSMAAAEAEDVEAIELAVQEQQQIVPDQVDISFKDDSD